MRDSDRASAPALRTFERIADRWGLDPAERYRILGLRKSTYYRYRSSPKQAALAPDTLERISYVLGIYKALQILLPRREAADAWVKRPNQAPLFAGEPPLSVLLRGKVLNLYAVRRYLDAQRGW